MNGVLSSHMRSRYNVFFTLNMDSRQPLLAQCRLTTQWSETYIVCIIGSRPVGRPVWWVTA